MEPRGWVLIVFITAFALILSEKVHRTIAAWFGCVCMLFCVVVLCFSVVSVLAECAFSVMVLSVRPECAS